LDNKLGLGAMTALVIGSMIGAGVFSLPQNMASVASPAAVMIGWSITGVGMIFLALAFQHLSHLKPEIESGVFGYAQAGFGDFVGFCSAWGYWLSAMLDIKVNAAPPAQSCFSLFTENISLIFSTLVVTRY